MMLRFHGAVRNVTGSLHELNVSGGRVLVDCGLYQGSRAKANRRNRRFPFDPAGVSNVLLTHAHLDHAGNLPGLVRRGFLGSVFGTAATRDLAAVMLADSGRIQERDAAWWRKHRSRRAPFEPLYTEADARETAEHLVGYPYHRWFEVADGVRAQFLDAGHILGSATVLIEVRDRGRTERILYSGDIGRRDVPILRDPEIAPAIDWLVIESTYGDRVHPPMENLSARLRTAMRRVVKRGGRLIIPAFSVGRTQHIVYLLDGLAAAGDLPPLDVCVDSPLAVDVTEIFRLHAECFDEEATRLLAAGDDPLGFSRLRYVRTVPESKALNERDDPFVVISASGMCEGGRVLHHLRRGLPDKRNLVLFSGFQAPGTLGRRLVDGERTVRLLGDRVPVRAEIQSLAGLSAHADRDGLLAFARAHAGPTLRGVFVVHGEESASLALARRLRKAGLPGVVVPEEGVEYDTTRLAHGS